MKTSKNQREFFAYSIDLRENKLKSKLNHITDEEVDMHVFFEFS